MPTIRAQGKTIQGQPDANLRRVLLDQGIDLHNGNAKLINCRGIGSCGTCAVHIEGNLPPRNWKEKARLALPPHSLDAEALASSDRRLACQIQIPNSPQGHLKISKGEGFWGQHDTIRWGPE